MSRTHIDLYERVKQAGYAFSGTVESISVEEVPTTIVTHVVFGKLNFAKGVWSGDRIVLTLEGGEIGGREVRGWEPRFGKGDRYIVLSLPSRGSSRDSYMPVVGQTDGAFRVKSGHPGPPRVFDWSMRPIKGVAIREIDLSKNSTEPVTEAEFLETLRKISVEVSGK